MNANNTKTPNIYCQITYLHSVEGERGGFDRIIVVKVQCEECQGLAEFRFGVKTRKTDLKASGKSYYQSAEVNQLDIPKWCPHCSGVFPDSYAAYLGEAIRNSYLFPAK